MLLLSFFNFVKNSVEEKLKIVGIFTFHYYMYKYIYI